MIQKLQDRDLDQVTGGAGVQNGGLKARLRISTRNADVRRPATPRREYADNGLSLHDFPVRVLADHFPVAKRVEVATTDLFSRSIPAGAREGPS
jgi:hypothetical protein